MSEGATKAIAEARALAARYVDPRARWSVADDDRARAVREDPAARRAWAVAIATHRAMVGAPDGLPSGVEQRRQSEIALARAGVAGITPEPGAPSSAWSWLVRLVVPVVAVAAGALVAVQQIPEPVTPEAWIRARGMGHLELPGPHVGLGVGGVTEGGREYEAISSRAVFLEDWLRFSYTNERSDIAWLYLFALQPDAGDKALRPIAPLPEDARSLPLTLGRFVQLPFETRVAARHEAGPLRLVALFTAAPLDVAVVDKAVADLDPAALRALPSELEARLREHLQLPPGDVVQILDTTIVPGSAAPALPDPRQESP